MTKRFKTWLRQAHCVHWFDEPTTHSFSESTGPIICTQQKTWLITEETRVCSKCGLEDRRTVGDPIYEGWY